MNPLENPCVTHRGVDMGHWRELNSIYIQQGTRWALDCADFVDQLCVSKFGDDVIDAVGVQMTGRQVYFVQCKIRIDLISPDLQSHERQFLRDFSFQWKLWEDFSLKKLDIVRNFTFILKNRKWNFLWSSQITFIFSIQWSDNHGDQRKFNWNSVKQQQFHRFRRTFCFCRV
jgi:hypothetical protein